MAAYEPQRSSAPERWRYIRRYGDRRQVVLPNTDDGPPRLSGWMRAWGSDGTPR